MRVLVCGHRYWSKARVIKERVARLPAGTTVIHGASRGADTIAGKVAAELGFAVEAFPAEWSTQGKAAGPIRNRKMLDTSPDLVIAFHENLERSKGTKDCVDEAR